MIYAYIGVMFYLNSKAGINLSAFLTPIPILFLIILKNDIQAKIITFITKSYSILFLFSLLVWIMLLAGVNLPNGGTISHGAWGAYKYVNYFICLKSTGIYMFRFNCIFLEPGHTGMVAALLLFVNRLNFKNKYLWSILGALLFTLSLAGYVLLLISIALYIIFIVKRSTKYIMVISIVCFGLYLFFVNYNNGDNYINSYIIERLKFVDGNIAGNNRTGSDMDRFYSRFVEKSDFFYGIGSEEFKNTGLAVGNSGYKVFIVTNGLIGAILTLIVFFLFSLNNKSKESLLLLVLFSINFIHRAYPFWSILLLIFIGGISLMESTRKQESKTITS